MSRGTAKERVATILMSELLVYVQVHFQDCQVTYTPLAAILVTLDCEPINLSRIILTLIKLYQLIS